MADGLTSVDCALWEGGRQGLVGSGGGRAMGDLCTLMHSLHGLGSIVNLVVSFQDL